MLGALAMGLVAVVGLRALAQETPEDGSGFVDIVENIHEEDIRYIVERELTVGCDLTGPRYCPDQDVTRAEMATFLTRALRLDTKVPYLGVYTDVAEGVWYTPLLKQYLHFRETNQPLTRSQNTCPQKRGNSIGRLRNSTNATHCPRQVSRLYQVRSVTRAFSIHEASAGSLGGGRQSPDQKPLSRW